MPIVLIDGPSRRFSTPRTQLIQRSEPKARKTAAQTPLVSVVIPTFNRSTFITRAVDSVLRQQFTDFEIIVVDDGSTDSTGEHLKNKYGDRINYIYQSNSGVSAARNTGIRNANGTWLAFLDSDDEWQPDYLIKQVTQANKIPTLCMQSTNCLFTSISGNSHSYFEINRSITAFKGNDNLVIERPFSFVVSHGPWQVGSTIFLRDAIYKAGPFDTNMNISEDFDFMARVSLQGSFCLIKEELVKIFRRTESIECLTDQARKDPLGARKSNERIYQKLQLIPSLNHIESKALNRAMGANRRAIGNLLLQAGDKTGARDYYRRAIRVDFSARSLGKYFLSYLPSLFH